MTRTERGSVLELSTTPLRVIRCCGPAATIDRLRHRERWLSGRIAPDELLLLVPASEFDEALGDVAAELETAGAIVVDHTDAFAITTLSGDFHQAIARLTAISPPKSGFFQGLVAAVACKAILTPDRMYLLAPSTNASHVRERLLVACADLGVRENTEPKAAWPGSGATS